MTLRAYLAGLLTVAASVLVGCSATPTASTPAPPAKTGSGPTTPNESTRSPLATAPLITPGAASPAVSPTAPGPTEVSDPRSDGRGSPGPYVLGRADAPVTIEEYADFQ